MFSQFLKRLYLFLIFISCFNHSIAQDKTPLPKELIALRLLMDKHHVSPRAIDDKLSEDIFYQFIQLLDYRQVYFMQSDIVRLRPFAQLLDDELNGGKTSGLLAVLIPLYKERLLSAEKRIQQITDKSFDFESKSSLLIPDRDTLLFPADEKAAFAFWEKVLKYRILSMLYNKYGDEKPAQILAKQTISSKEAEMRQKIRLIETRKIKRILEHPDGFEQYVSSRLILAFTLCFDPHSAFMSFTEKENFNAGTSEEVMSFGIDLSESSDEEIEIERLIPGGPAWKSNELHVGDILLKIKWQNKESIDLSGAEVEEVFDLLDESNDGKLEITVRKTNGIVKTITLYKAKIREDENIVKSFIIKGTPKVGYISLPGFYDSFENSDASGCAVDVAREVLKMKKEGVEGIILDLRFNGGGSLTEGLDLAGIFIDEGPLVISYTREGKPQVLKDANRGTVYDAPLLVMTNQQSASASEILAAALQDYNRALIVGNRTFGKSTGQRIIPLEDDPTKKEIAFAKITTLKLYRITGRTAQLNGIKPDLFLPDLFDFSDYREEMMPHALKADSISKKTYYTALPPLPIKELQSKQQIRFQNKAAFTAISTTVKKLKELEKQGRKEIPLDWQAYGEWYNNFLKLWLETGSFIEKPANILPVENLTADKTLLSVDNYGKEINDLLIKKITEDIYIEESYQVMKDWISILKK